MAREIPAFGNEKEEAEFWDTHNTLDYIVGDPVKLELDPQLSKKIADRQKRKELL